MTETAGTGSLKRPTRLPRSSGQFLSAAAATATDASRSLYLAYAVAAAGVVVRIMQYALNPSLSEDESLLALNIIRRPARDLLHTLDFNQAAPAGFLLIERGSVALFGRSEYALRLFPLIASIAAIATFPLAARALLGTRAALFAMLAFAISDSVIYYSGTAKQYSIDVAATVLLSWLGLRALGREASVRIGTLILVGAAAVWLSYPAAFVLFAVGATLLVRFAVDRRAWAATVMAGGTLLWLISFVISYSVSLPSVKHLQRSFSGTTGFIGGGADGSSVLNDYLGVFRYAAGIPQFSLFGMSDPGYWAAGVAALLFLVGFCALSLRKPSSAAVLLGPLAVALVASAFHRYPLVARTALFAAPAVVIGIAAGAAAIARAAPFARALAVAALTFIAISLSIPAIRHLDRPRTTEELKPVLHYLSRAERPGDVLYVYYKSQYAFRYYLSCRCLERVAAAPRDSGLWPLTRFVGGAAQWAPALVSSPPSFRVGIDRGRDPSSYVADFRKLKGRPRVWVMLSDLPHADRAFLLRELDRLGRRRVAFKPGENESAAGVYLYDLR